MKKGRGRKRKQNKQGQIFGMSFQFIFSVILIAITLFVAFWAIQHFMSVAEQGKILSFKENFENRVESIWGSTYEVNTTYTFDLSSKIKWVCFANATADIKPPEAEESRLIEKVCLEGYCWSEETFVEEVGAREEYNLFLLPLGTAEKYNAQSSFMVTCKGKNCLEFENADCIPVENGKVTIRIAKGGEILEPGKVHVSAP